MTVEWGLVAFMGAIVLALTLEFIRRVHRGFDDE